MTIKDRCVTASQISIMIGNLDNTQLKINSACGAAVMVELRMRLIGELCEIVQEKLKDLIKNKNESSEYWNCKLHFLDDTIDAVFQTALSLSERQELSEFRSLRNKLLHGNFVGLMKLLGISPDSRFIQRDGSKTLLNPPEIKEAILSINNKGGFEAVELKAKKVLAILDKILLSLAVG